MPRDLQQALDHLDILNLYASYTYAADKADKDGFIDCFTPDATNDISSFVKALGSAGQEIIGQFADERGVVTGHDNLRKLASLALDAHHVSTNIRIRFIDADRAEGCAYFVVFTPDEGRVEHYGRYEDELVRCPDGRWRMKSRKDIAIYERDHPLPHNYGA